MITVKAIKHSDVRGKELYYLKASNGNSDVLVNVGKTTYEAVLELETEPKHSAVASEAIKTKGGK